MSTTKEFKSQLRELGIDVPEGFGSWPAEAQQAFCESQRAFVESQRALAQAKADAEEARKSATSRRKLTRREKFKKFAQTEQASLAQSVLDDLNSFERSEVNNKKRARYETLRVLALLYKRGELSPAMTEKIESTFPDS